MPNRQPGRDLPPQIRPQRRHSLPVTQTVQSLQHQRRGDHIDRDRRPATPRREQVIKQGGREQDPTLISQQPEHRPLLDQMTSHGLSVKKLTLIKRTTLHTTIVSARETSSPHDTLCSAVS